jgi:hypothetical protein
MADTRDPYEDYEIEYVEGQGIVARPPKRNDKLSRFLDSLANVNVDIPDPLAEMEADRRARMAELDAAARTAAEQRRAAVAREEAMVRELAAMRAAVERSEAREAEALQRAESAERSQAEVQARSEARERFMIGLTVLSVSVAVLGVLATVAAIAVG